MLETKSLPVDNEERNIRDNYTNKQTTPSKIILAYQTTQTNHYVILKVFIMTK